MKKALVLFLVLAVVAGGLFAQVGWSGQASGSAGIDLNDDDLALYTNLEDAYELADDNFALSYTKDEWKVSLTLTSIYNNHSNSVRDVGTLAGHMGGSVAFNSADGLYGFTLGAKFRSTTVSGTTGLGFPIDNVRGYYKFFDGDLRADVQLLGGNGWVNDYSPVPGWKIPINAADNWDNPGSTMLKLTYTGIDKVSLALVVPNIQTGNFTTSLKDLRLLGKYTDAFTLAGGLRTVAAGTDGISANLFVDFVYNNLAMDGLNLLATAYVTNLFASSELADLAANLGLRVEYGTDVADGVNVSGHIKFGGTNNFDSLFFSGEVGASLSGDITENWEYGADVFVGFDVPMNTGDTFGLRLDITPSATWAVGTGYLNLRYNLGFDFMASGSAMLDTHNIEARFKWTF